MLLSFGYAAENGETAVFQIKAFDLEGNTIFPANKLQETLKPFTGSRKTAADVEKARDALEKLHHDAGYPAVVVNIPEQTVEGGVIRLQVIESRIGRVKVSGNRYFTTEKIMRDLPSFQPGEMLYVPRVQQEIGRLNRNEDFKVDPVMAPGKEPGTVDVELKVADRLPLHGSLELNNRASHDTTDLRLNTMLRYDNLWQREHSISLQYQTSPEKLDEVQVVAGSYVLRAPWHEDHTVALYGIWSDSNTATGEGFSVVGKGLIFGTRYVIPLPPYKLYGHSLTLGVDYKDFQESLGFATANESSVDTPVTYMPFSASYSASLQDEWGITQFSGGLNLSFRGLVSDQREFEAKRYQGKPNYLYVTAGAQRTQKLPWETGLFVKVDGQVADQPLIDNEQYSAGGVDSVRGYKESEALGDHALHATVEFSLPDPLKKFGIGKRLQMSPYLFYDVARLMLKDPLPGQDENITLQGVGAGVRGSLLKYLEYQFDWAMALSKTDLTQRNDQQVYFKLKFVF
jgi:hemolysin activation/secretion protein